MKAKNTIILALFIFGLAYIQPPNANALGNRVHYKSNSFKNQSYSLNQRNNRRFINQDRFYFQNLSPREYRFLKRRGLLNRYRNRFRSRLNSRFGNLYGNRFRGISRYRYSSY